MISVSSTLHSPAEAPALGLAGTRPEESLPYAFNPCRVHILGGRGSGATLLGLAQCASNHDVTRSGATESHSCEA